MAPRARRRKARAERIRVVLSDAPTGSVPISLPSKRPWPIGLVFAVFLAIFASIAVGQILSMRGRSVDNLFDLAFLLFQGFWVLGWSVGVLILFLLTMLFLFYAESARITGQRLVHVPRLGPFKILVEYDLAKVRNLRVAPKAGGGRIRFDYGEGESGLGNNMPLAAAEAGVRAIASAIERLGRAEPVEHPAPLPAAEAAARHLPPEAAGPAPRRLGRSFYRSRTPRSGR